MLARNRVRSRRKGAAMIEAAFTLPVFLGLLLGGVLLAVQVFQQQELTRLTRNSARWASLQDPASLTSAQVAANVPTSNPGGFDPTKMDVQASRVNGYTTSVTISYPKATSTTPSAFSITKNAWNPY